MPEQITQTDTDSPEPPAADRKVTAESEAAADRPVQPATLDIQTPQFSQLRDSGQSATDNSMARFRDVNVTVSAELGRVALPIADLLELGEGSVVEMHQPVSGPIDLVANGVRIARGEVVVVDDCFAIRIKEIET